MTRLFLIALLLAGTLAASVSPAAADPLRTTIDLQATGLDLSEDGTGSFASSTRTLDVNTNGPVVAAILYWGGSDRPCPQSGDTCVIPAQPYRDQVVKFAGVTVSGEVLGTEAEASRDGGSTNHIAYRKDVTSIVQARPQGANSFTIADANPANNLATLQGAGLIVLHQSPSGTTASRIVIAEGADFVPRGEASDLVRFQHGAAAFTRNARVSLVAAGGTASRQDAIDVPGNGTRASCLKGADGAAWDTPSLAVPIAPGESATSVGLRSARTGPDPDELFWFAAAIRTPIGTAGAAPPNDCALAPDLAVTAGAPETVAPGGTISYTVNLANAGAGPAHAAKLEDALPAGLTFLDATAPAGWTTAAPTAGAAGTVTFTKEEVAAHETAEFTIRAAVDPAATVGGTIENSARASSNDADADTTNEVAAARTTVVAPDPAPAPSPAPAPVDPAGQPPAPPRLANSIAISTRRAALRRKIVRVAVKCKGEPGSRCRGSLQLTPHRGKRVSFGKASFSIAAGRKATIRVRASRRLRLRLAKPHKLRATATAKVAQPGAAPLRAQRRITIAKRR